MVVLEQEAGDVQAVLAHGEVERLAIVVMGPRQRRVLRDERLDGFEIPGEVVDRAGIRLDGVIVPTVLIVDRDGRILFAIEGRAQPERFQDAAALIKRLSTERAR